MTETTWQPWPPHDEPGAELEEYDPPLPEPADDESAALPWLSPLQELRAIRESAGTTAEHIDYAVNGAYAVPGSVWRRAHIVWAYTGAAAVTLACDLLKWSFCRFSRALVAIPVLLALLWLLNHVPVTQWLIPDQWDASTWLPHELPPEPGTVEVPLDIPVDGE